MTGNWDRAPVCGAALGLKERTLASGWSQSYHLEHGLRPAKKTSSLMWKRAETLRFSPTGKATIQKVGTGDYKDKRVKVPKISGGRKFSLKPTAQTDTRRLVRHLNNCKYV